MKSDDYFLNRIDSLRNKFDAWGVVGCIVENRIDLYYLTGLRCSSGILLVLKEGASLFVDGRYFQDLSSRSPVPVKLLSKESLSQHIPHLGSIAIDSHFTSLDRGKQLQLIVPHLFYVSRLLRETRGIKDPDEIVKLKKAALLAWDGFQYVRKRFRVGVQEKEISFAFEQFCKERGAERLAFDPIIAFGANSAYPHHRSGDSRLKQGDIILCDLGIVLDGYHSDMTRTFFYGEGDLKLRALLSTVMEAHSVALKNALPGTVIGELDQIVRTVFEDAGYGDLIAHGLGHGVGLEIHEYPSLQSKGEDKELLLREGMVITIEPGLYIPGLGGARYEDTILITQTGYSNLYR